MAPPMWREIEIRFQFQQGGQNNSDDAIGQVRSGFWSL
jgi:hypothetical protein